ncbi:hypothetical protein [Acinetobacter populi]|uniref:Uncharacterized protein n=1 Tax=Acinetobacter populi TaxID=1582270 RepID=A0A1Z9YTP2_9GAMM|nr:hypothetical protein [Acinetobacter populi]OUY05553.1 hypothetical protein CAP51_16545 [Acinetobacter populi]
MYDQSWHFIFALHQQINAYLRHDTYYPYIEHAWIKRLGTIFLVRDFNTGDLIYDSTEHFTVHLSQQELATVHLVPLVELFESQPFHHPILDFPCLNHFQQRNQAILILSFKNSETYALLPCIEKIKTEITVPSNCDPRDFLGFESDQNHSPYALFTLYRLSIAQVESVKAFVQPIEWQNYAQNLQDIMFSAQYYPYEAKPLQATNNLYLYQDGYDTPLIQDQALSDNLAFSLIKQMQSVFLDLESYCHPKNDSSPYHLLSDEEYKLFNEYQTTLGTELISLICRAANDYPQAGMTNKTSLTLPCKNLPVESITGKIPSPPIPQEPDDLSEDKPSVIKSLFSLILFLAVVFAVMYGIFLLSEQFAFIRFLLVVMTVIAFLAIVARK